MQVQVRGKDGMEWVSVKASHATEPYRYATQEEAERQLRNCYPDQCLLGGDGTVRVKEID